MIALSYADTMAEFGMGQEVATLGLSLFVLGMGTFPLVVGPLSEFYGRRIVYTISFTLFLAFVSMAWLRRFRG